MKLTNVLSVLFATLLLATVAVAADDSATKKPVELKNQTNCPVMGGTIDSTVFTDIQGQRVYHCCSACSAPLKNDPDKYFKKAAADGVLFENIQTTCPVSGEELKDKSVFTDFEGRRVVFCCNDCQKKFDKDPARFIKALDSAPAKDAGTMKKMKSMEGHEGHNH